MKAVSEWFAELPTQIREKALDNAKKDNSQEYLKWFMEQHSPTMSYALMGAFDFEFAKEGCGYWFEMLAIMEHKLEILN